MTTEFVPGVGISAPDGSPVQTPLPPLLTGQMAPIISGDASQRSIRFYINRHIGFIERDLPPHLDEAPLVDNNTFRRLSVAGVGHHVFKGSNSITSSLGVVIKGSSNCLIIGSDTKLRGEIGILGNGLVVFISRGTTFNSVSIVCKGDNNGVYIGRDCMLSSEIEIRTSDGHAIVSLETNEKVNNDSGVFLGDHIWIGKRAMIQKGACVAGDSIVGFGSMVVGRFDSSNVVLAGTPAKILRENVTWTRSASGHKRPGSMYDWKNLSEL